MKKILVIGASGFVGSHLTNALLTNGYTVRCLTRDPARLQRPATSSGEIVPGDVADPASLGRALHGMDAVYISMHTISRQQSGPAGGGFVDLEKRGVTNILDACRTQAVRRIIYVTSLGVGPDEPGEWVRGRWALEQRLLNSGLDVTILRPGQIVGAGGMGFKTTLAQARSRVAILVGSGGQHIRSIAIDDFVYYLVGILSDPRSYGKAFDVGADDVWTSNQMIDVIAALLGKKPPVKLHLPTAILGLIAPGLERMARLSKGSVRGFLDSLKTDMVGDPLPIRTLLPRPPLSYREAVQQALRSPPGQ